MPNCNLQDELEEAREIIRALLGAPPPRIWKQWPILHKKATAFLKRGDDDNRPNDVPGSHRRGDAKTKEILYDVNSKTTTLGAGQHN